MSQTHKPLCEVLFLSFFELKNHVTSVDFTSFIYQCLNTWAARFMLSQLTKQLLIFSQIHSIPHETRTGKSQDSVVTVLCGFEAYIYTLWFPNHGHWTTSTAGLLDNECWKTSAVFLFRAPHCPQHPARKNRPQPKVIPMDWLTM